MWQDLHFFGNLQYSSAWNRFLTVPLRNLAWTSLSWEISFIGVSWFGELFLMYSCHVIFFFRNTVYLHFKKSPVLSPMPPKGSLLILLVKSSRYENLWFFKIFKCFSLVLLSIQCLKERQCILLTTKTWLFWE